MLCKRLDGTQLIVSPSYRGSQPLAEACAYAECEAMCDPLSATDRDFQTFCGSVRQWLRSAPHMDAALTATVDLLDRKTWFQCEVRHLVANATDIHAALGASVLLGLWQAVAGWKLK